MVHFQQKQVLAFREELLATVQTSDDRENLDAKTFERLKHVSPEGLVPILIQRNHEDWIAAFLIQEVGLSSKRFLVKAITMADPVGQEISQDDPGAPGREDPRAVSGDRQGARRAL